MPALLLLSCSEPFSAVKVPVGTTGRSSGVEISARLLSVQRVPGARTVFRVAALAHDSAGRPRSDIPVIWSTFPQSDTVEGESVTGEDGIARLTWYVQDTLAPLHLLTIEGPEGAAARLAAAAGLTNRFDVYTDSFPLPVDTVLALLPGGAAVRVVDRQGRPVSGARVLMESGAAGGALAHAVLTTDAAGTVRTDWRLGTHTGMQEVSVRLAGAEGRLPGDITGYQLEDVVTGAVAPAADGLRLRAVAMPGTPTRLVLGTDTLDGDAIGARLPISVLGYDTWGNMLVQPRLHLVSLDTMVAKPEPNAALRTTGPGQATVYVTAGTASDSFVVRVEQRPVEMATWVTTPGLSWVGARTQVGAPVIDRLGAPIAGVSPTFRSLTPALLGLAGPDTIVALNPGTGVLESSFGGLADTVQIALTQVPASIVVSRSADTMLLDEVRAVNAQVMDSGGTPIQGAPLTITPENPAIVDLDSPGILDALLPGETSVTLTSGALSASFQVAVEGVALLADGVRTTDEAAVAGARNLEITNGRVRIRRDSTVSDRAGYIMEVRDGQVWRTATVYGANDWVFVTSSVSTEPTSIDIVEHTPDRIAIGMRFGNHWFNPAQHGYPEWYQAEPFPFTRTVWLSPRENGYYSWVEIERAMSWAGIELETGFGGLWGPATIRTGREQFRTEDQTENKRFNVPSVPDAAEFARDGDPLLRVLVPLPEAPMISPVFPGWGYGSVWVHRDVYESFGAYLHAAPRGAERTARQICQDAWSNAPFPLRTLSAAELDSCGPS